MIAFRTHFLFVQVLKHGAVPPRLVAACQCALKVPGIPLSFLSYIRNEVQFEVACAVAQPFL